MRLALAAVLLLLLPSPARGETLTVHVAAPGSALALPEGQDQADAGRFWSGLQRLDAPGLAPEPVLPVLVLLPPGARPTSAIAVEFGQCSPSHWDATQRDTTRSLRSMGSGDALPLAWPWADCTKGRCKPPASGVAAGRITLEGDAVLLPLLLFPLRPSDGQGPRPFCRTAAVHVGWQRARADAAEASHYLPERLARHAVNAGMLDTWYTRRRDDAQTHDYLIVTRKLLADTSKVLPAFVEFKTQQGHTPLVVTLEEIEAQADDPSLPPQELVRSWLQANAEPMNARFLLLIGNPALPDPLLPGPEVPRVPDDTSLPMKECFPTKGFGTEDEFPNVPTDMYYADLTGDWNPDGDEFPCELEDYMEIPETPPDPDPGQQPEPEPGQESAPPRQDRLDGVDLSPELLVGRIPHAGKLPYFMDGVLERLMAYEQAPPDSWHNRALLATPMVTFPDGGYVDGGLVARFLIQKSLQPAGYGATTLTEWEGNLVSKNPGDGPLDKMTFAETYNAGYGAVFWCAHGNTEGAYQDRWYNDTNGDGLPQQGETTEPPFVHVDFFEEYSGLKPAVMFQGSCLNADPSDLGNIASTLLRHASVANVASTRITMGLASGEDDEEWTPSPFAPGAFTMGVYFIHGALVARKTVSEAFGMAGSALSFGAQPWTFKVRLEFNLFGDPSLSIPACSQDAHCDDADVCNGQETCVDGRCKAGTPLQCPPDDPAKPCDDSTCLPDQGCTVVTAPDLTPCDDGDPCTDDNMCLFGKCAAGNPVVCQQPAEPCYTSACQPESGECLYQPLPDGAACFTALGPGTCDAGECVPDASPQPDAYLPADDVTAADVGSDVTPTEPAGSSGGCASGRPAPPAAAALCLLALTGLLRRIRRGSARA
jgi:hypothetical protein